MIAQHQLDRQALEQQLQEAVSLKSRLETSKHKQDGYSQELKTKLTRAQAQVADLSRQTEGLSGKLAQAQLQAVGAMAEHIVW